MTKKNTRATPQCGALAMAIPTLVLAANGAAQGWIDAPQRLASDPQATALNLAMGDLDADGDIDLVQRAGTTLQVRRNSGNGTFTPGATWSLPSGVLGPFVHGDFDGDGHTDLAMAALPASSFGAAVVILPTDATGAFGAPIAVALPQGLLVDRLVVGDANADGIDDLGVVTFGVGAPRQARWLFGDVNRVFSFGPVGAIASGQGALIDDLVAFDADGDGRSDLGLLGAGLVQVLTTSVTTPVQTGTVPVAFTAGAWLAGGDFDGDLDDDLILVGGASQGMRRYLLTSGGGTFVSQSLDIPGVEPGPVLVGDWDGDGAIDAFVRSGANFAPAIGYALFAGDGAGGLQLAWSRSYFLPAQEPVGLADLDGDQKLDLVDGGALLFGCGTTDAPGAGPNVFPHELLDWEGDGDLDAVGRTAAGLRLYQNDGSGAFTTVPLAWPAGPAADRWFGSGVVTADFDGDGLQDQIVPLLQVLVPFPPVGQFLAMHRLEFDGTGGMVDLGPATAPGVEIRFPSFAIDTDGDGDLDLVDRTGVFVQTAGSFVPVPQPFAGFQPLAAGDLDGDGDVDLVGGGNGTTNGLALLQLVAPSTFAVTIVQPVVGGSLPTQGLALADFDDDGDLDLAADPTTSDGAPRLWTNQGGVFTLAATVTIAGETTGRPMAADVDGDGRTDLVYSSGNGLAVLRRNSAGLTYDAPVRFAIFANGFVDIDQDGDPDPVGSWNRNKTFAGVSAGSRRQFGTSPLGSGGRRPVLSATGIVRAGSTPVLRLRQALGGGLSVLALGSFATNTPLAGFPGLFIYVSPFDATLTLILGGAPGLAGAGTMDLPLFLPPGLSGATFHLQHFVLDPAGILNLTHSNGLTLEIGG